jgi:uridine phosphorylase
MGIPFLTERFDESPVLSAEDFIKHLEEFRKRKRPKVPDYAVFSFWPSMYDVVKKKYKVRESKFLSDRTPFLTFDHKGMKVVFLVFPIGAPMSGAILEMMFALGTKYAIFFGAPGVLSPNIERCEIILPTKALRDEGTSYHYEEPSLFSYPSNLVLKHIERTLKSNEIPYYKGGVWTTDALFRETPRKVKENFKKGCIAVDMEASALFSISRFWNNHISAIFHAADCVGGKKWEPRISKKGMRKEKATATKVLELSIESLHSLHSEL